MKKIAKKSVVLLAFVALAASFTSCNRGYGCPTNFSVEGAVTTAVTTVVSACVNND